jgi:5-formyltetrahydrofolate cyclo-ligase
MAVPPTIPHPNMTLAGDKSALRAHSAEQRRAASASSAAAAGAAVVTHLLAALTLDEGALIAGYWPMRDELDPRPTMERLAGAGCALALPVVVARGEALAFRTWKPGAALVPGAFGTLVPPSTAALMCPDVLLVPLLAFDAAGYRLGYGGGYYDCTLRALRRSPRPPLAVGIGYAAQEVPGVPHGARDERLDWIITELQARCFG